VIGIRVLATTTVLIATYTTPIGQRLLRQHWDKSRCQWDTEIDYHVEVDCDARTGLISLSAWG